MCCLVKMPILNYLYLFFEALLVFLCPCLQEEIDYEKIDNEGIKFHEKCF